MHSMPVCRQLIAQALLAEASNPDDPLARRRAFGQPCERRTNLATNAEDDEIAIEFRQIGYQGRIRRGHHVF